MSMRTFFRGGYFTIGGSAGGVRWPCTGVREAMASKVWLLILGAALSGLFIGTPVMAADGEAIWDLLRSGGQIVVMRHASTERGVGDPPGFRLEDCHTQRNLSAAGREEARRLGQAFRVRSIPVGQVLSSRWCRCLETAQLAFGTFEPWPPLDSFFNDRSHADAQTQAVRKLIAELPPGGNLLLVSHQVNITALTQLFPAPGEMIVLTPLGNGEFRVAGRLAASGPFP
jgi:phosphohistidine phosphatase SixA